MTLVRIEYIKLYESLLDSSYLSIPSSIMPKILILYATGEGQTLKIAERIAQVIRDTSGSEIILKNAKETLPEDFSCRDFDGILLGSSLRNRRYANSIVDFIRKYKVDLESRPSGFFSVSGGDGCWWSKLVDQLVDRTLKEWGWQPKLVGRFGGAMLYTQYDFWTKWSMWAGGIIMGYPHDTSRDHELTDWDQVEKFASDFVDEFKGQTAESEVRS